MNRSTGTKAVPDVKHRVRWRLAPTTTGSHARPEDRDHADGARQPRWLRYATGPFGQTTVSAFVLGLLLHMRYGYAVGERDHAVLSPLGMQWAHPDWFAGDWIVANAPQPHWLFDLVTWAGSASGTLPLLYLLYWIAGLIVFGAATSLLARAWVPQATWPAILAVTVFAAVSPTSVLGASAMLFATPLPNVFGGALLYLTSAALLTGRTRLAVYASIATAFIHVQLGTMTAVLLAIMAGVAWRRHRESVRALALGALISGAVVVVALQTRPVAGHLSDFAEVCDTLIPYHCEATTWTRAYLLGGGSLVVFALLTYFFLPVSQRWRAVVVLGLPAIGTVGGVAADRLNVPFLGLLAQGLNIYRLMLVLLPFAFWGVLVPMFAELRARQRWLVLGLVLTLGVFALQLGWSVSGAWTLKGSLLVALFAGVLVFACVARTVPDVVRRPERAIRWATALMPVVVVASGWAAQLITPQPFVVGLFPQGALADWGQRAEQLVPSGSQLLAPPLDWGVRMATKRAVVADCKYGPYGGEAWKEYKARIEAMGGFDQCLGTQGANTYNDLPGDTLAEVARRYHADFIIVETYLTPETRNVRESRVSVPESTEPPRPTGSDQKDSLTRMGWTVLLGPEEEVPFYLLKAPASTP